MCVVENVFFGPLGKDMFVFDEERKVVVVGSGVAFVVVFWCESIIRVLT